MQRSQELEMFHNTKLYSLKWNTRKENIPKCLVSPLLSVARYTPIKETLLNIVLWTLNDPKPFYNTQLIII